MKKCASSWLK